MFKLLLSAAKIIKTNETNKKNGIKMTSMNDIFNKPLIFIDIDAAI